MNLYHQVSGELITLLSLPDITTFVYDLSSDLNLKEGSNSAYFKCIQLLLTSIGAKKDAMNVFFFFFFFFPNIYFIFSFLKRSYILVQIV